MAGPERDLVFAPLGGVGEIGMNLAIYGLGDARSPHLARGRCRRRPSPRRKTCPASIWCFPTSAIWSKSAATSPASCSPTPTRTTTARCSICGRSCRSPVYATPFTAALLDAKRRGEYGAPEIPVKQVALGSRFNVGPFDIELCSVAHSIPESNALILRTPHGNVLHTGDWKLDPTPVLGLPTDEAKLRALGAEGCHVLIGDFHQCGARRPLAVGDRRGEDPDRADPSRRRAASR